MAKNPRLIDLAGKTFGQWTVSRQTGNTPGGGALWLCRCSCGVERSVLGQDLRRGKSVSCGCKNTQALAAAARKHGHSGTRLHRIWKGMRRRCRDPNATGYEFWGGRGISVCADWDSFSAFHAWAFANGYRDDLTIERMDVDGNYTPENCMWAGAAVQSANRRFVSKAPDGELWWHKARRNGITWSAYQWRISKGWPLKLAVTRPLGQRRTKRARDASGKFV